MLANYEPILRRFIRHEISGQEFETDFLSQWRGHRRQPGSPELDIINEIFYDVDEYVDDPDLRERAGGMDTATLRTKVRDAYLALYNCDPGSREG
ncbi:colicin immunity domain-containing protein [Smaragdicoccus niigatensis]